MYKKDTRTTKRGPIGKGLCYLPSRIDDGAKQVQGPARPKANHLGDVECDTICPAVRRRHARSLLHAQLGGRAGERGSVNLK